MIRFFTQIIIFTLEIMENVNTDVVGVKGLDNFFLAAATCFYDGSKECRRDTGCVGWSSSHVLRRTARPLSAGTRVCCDHRAEFISFTAEPSLGPGAGHRSRRPDQRTLSYPAREGCAFRPTDRSVQGLRRLCPSHDLRLGSVRRRPDPRDQGCTRPHLLPQNGRPPRRSKLRASRSEPLPPRSPGRRPAKVQANPVGIARSCRTPGTGFSRRPDRMHHHHRSS